jgi:hypothetical protein
MSPLSPLSPGGPWGPESPLSPLGPGGPWGPGAPAGPVGPPGPGWRCRSASCLASLLTRASTASRRSDGDGLRAALGLAARTLLAWRVGAPRLAVLLLGLRAIAASCVKGDVGDVRYVSRANGAPPKHNGPLGITIPTGPSASHAMILRPASPPLRVNRWRTLFNRAGRYLSSEGKVKVEKSKPPTSTQPVAPALPRRSVLGPPRSFRISHSAFSDSPSLRFSDCPLPRLPVSPSSALGPRCSSLLPVSPVLPFPAVQFRIPQSGTLWVFRNWLASQPASVPAC